MQMRHAKFDNIKALLIFLVVFCHFSELFGGVLKYRLYMTIYLFHMPLFVFVSGYFSKFGLKNTLFKKVYPYIIFQILYCLAAGEQVQLSAPYWLMWYLFSLIVWSLFLPLFQRFPAVSFALSLPLCLAAGFLPVSYTLSLSHVLCFAVFFVLGVWTAQHKELFLALLKTKKARLTAVICAVLALVLTKLMLPFVQTNWLYYALPYAENGCTPLWRFIFLCIAFLWIFSLITLVPDKAVPCITNIGKYSLCVYLLHGFVRFWLEKTAIFCFSDGLNLLLALVLSLLTVLLFANKAVFRILKPFTDLGLFLPFKEKNGVQRFCSEWTAGCAIALFFCYILFMAYRVPIFETLAITVLTFLYHFAMRLAVGGASLCVPNRFFALSNFPYRAFPFEKRLQSAINIKRVKSKIPTFLPYAFSLSDNEIDEVFASMRRAEFVHILCAILSFVPLFFSILFGAFYVFLVTSIISAAFDLLFVTVQRYNLPRVMRYMERYALQKEKSVV